MYMQMQFPMQNAYAGADVDAYAFTYADAYGR